MNLIEQLGGYGAVKKLWVEGGSPQGTQLAFELLEHRRQHNIFEIGDSFVNYADDTIYIALSIDQNNRMHGKSGDKNVWTYFGRFGLRHATNEEIKAGCRL